MAKARSGHASTEKFAVQKITVRATAAAPRASSDKKKLERILWVAVEKAVKPRTQTQTENAKRSRAAEPSDEEAEGFGAAGAGREGEAEAEQADVRRSVFPSVWIRFFMWRVSPVPYYIITQRS